MLTETKKFENFKYCSQISKKTLTFQNFFDDSKHAHEFRKCSCISVKSWKQKNARELKKSSQILKKNHWFKKGSRVTINSQIEKILANW